MDVFQDKQQQKKLKHKTKSKERRAEQKAEALRIRKGHKLVKEANAVVSKRGESIMVFSIRGKERG